MMNQNSVLEQTRNVARQLEPLLPDLVFVGGCLTGLLITDPAVALGRPPVDMVAEVMTYVEYSAMEKRIHNLGFAQGGWEDASFCRWEKGSARVDLLPLCTSILGFANPWHHPAMDNAVSFDVGGGLNIRMAPAPFFVAAKVDAFRTDGHSDFAGGHDLVDVIVVVDGRAELTTEIAEAPDEVRWFLSHQFGELIQSEGFHQAIAAYLMRGAVSQARSGTILSRMEAISRLD